MNKTTVKALACLSLSALTLTVEARWEYYTEGKNSYIRQTLDDDSVNWVFRVTTVSKDAGELKIADGSGKVAGTSYVKGSGVLDFTDLEQDTGWKLVEVGSSLLGFDEFKNLITGKLVLPDVRLINCAAFPNQDMTEVVAPELTELKESGNKSGAFQGCKQLTKAPFPKLVSAGFCAFKDCSALEDVGTLDHLVKIGENAFAGCTSLTNFPMTLPEVISVGHYGFNGTPLTGDLSLPAVTYIGGWCFTSPKLTSLYAPNVVKMPGKGTFNGCSSLTNIVVGHALKELGTSNATPSFPSGLVSFTPLMPRAMTTISSSAFRSLAKLKSPLVWDCPDKRIIPGSFFVYCSSLSNITIGASVTNIGASAFQDISVGAEVRFLTPPSVLVDKSFYYKGMTAEKNNRRPRFYIISRSALAAWQASELVTGNAATFETFKTTKRDYPGKKTFGLVKISRSSTDTQYAWVIDGTKSGFSILIE